MHKVLMSASALALTLPGCAPFAGGKPIVTASAAACSTLLPSQWKQGVEAAPLPTGDTVGDWISFGDAQTGKLDQANGRTRDTIEIVERCEARDAQAVKRGTRGWFARLIG